MYTVGKGFKEDSTEGYEAKTSERVGLRARVRTHEISVTLSWDIFRAPSEEEAVLMNRRENLITLQRHQHPEPSLSSPLAIFTLTPWYF